MLKVSNSAMTSMFDAQTARLAGLNGRGANRPIPSSTPPQAPMATRPPAVSTPRPAMPPIQPTLPPQPPVHPGFRSLAPEYDGKVEDFSKPEPPGPITPGSVVEGQWPPTKEQIQLYRERRGAVVYPDLQRNGVWLTNDPSGGTYDPQ